MGKKYGWYSLDAYNDGKKEYLYLNSDQQITICTFITHEKNNPYNNSKYTDSVYCGEVETKY
jgi:hypothetical protein